MAKPSHLSVFFLRSIRVRREHIAGLPSAKEGESLVKVMERGETAKLVYDVAIDLVVAGSVLADTPENRYRIDEERKLIADERADARSGKSPKKELAPA